jgi:hypothetical protein
MIYRLIPRAAASGGDFHLVGEQRSYSSHRRRWRPRWGAGRRRNSDLNIDKRPQSGYITATPLTCQDAIRPTTGWRSGCGSRGHGLVTCAPGRLRQDTPGRHHDRSAGAISLDGDRKARVTPAVTLTVWTVRSAALRRARLSNHRGARAGQVPGSRVAEAERWRSVAAASAVVERRQASAPARARAAPQGAEVSKQRLSAFRFPFCCFCSPG